MIERADDTSNASPPPDEAAPSGMIRQLGTILGAARRSPVGRALWLLAVAILVVILVTAYGQILLNRWNKPFYDALSRRDLRDFLRQLGVFFLIASSLLVLNVAQRWLGETLTRESDRALFGLRAN